MGELRWGWDCISMPLHPVFFFSPKASGDQTQFTRLRVEARVFNNWIISKVPFLPFKRNSQLAPKLALNSPCSYNWSQTLGSSAHTCLVLGVRCVPPLLLLWNLGSEPRDPWILGKHSIHWATPAALFISSLPVRFGGSMKLWVQ